MQGFNWDIGSVRTVPIFQVAHLSNTYKVITPKSFFFSNQPIMWQQKKEMIAK
jgi:hypothetical protein